MQKGETMPAMQSTQNRVLPVAIIFEKELKPRLGNQNHQTSN